MFKNNAFPNSKLIYQSPDFFDLGTPTNRVIQTTNRAGRIDIAVMESRKYDSNSSEQLFSVAGIELKGISPDLSLVNADVERLIDAMAALDTIGANEIQKCYVAFAQRLDTDKMLFTEQKLKTQKNKFDVKLRASINKLAISPFQFNIEYFQITQQTTKGLNNLFIGHDLDYHEAVEKTGAVLGVVIELCR